MRTKSISFIACLIFVSSTANAVTYFNDGAYHLINYTINGAVYVDQGKPGVGTQIEVTTGGRISGNYYTVAFGNSHVAVTGGIIEWSLMCTDNSTAIVNNASYFGSQLEAAGYADVTVGDCTVTLSTVAEGHSVMHITDGSLGNYMFEVRNQAKVFWSGGTNSGDIMSGAEGSTNGCLITYIGTNFAVNGIPLENGHSARDYASHGTFSGYACLTGRITGTLANGDALNNTFYIFPGADIIVVPEPATLLLLGLGTAVAIRKQK
jgi:hypothetical protein